MNITKLVISVTTVVSTANAGASIVFDGATLPEYQGWVLHSSFGGFPTPGDSLDYSTDGSVLTLNTVGLFPVYSSELSGHALFTRDIGFQNGFSIEFSLKVNEVEQPHNQFDAGIAFLGGWTEGPGHDAEREQTVYFDQNAIGWGDNTAHFPLVTTDTFHTYRLDVDAFGNAIFYVDGLPALSRSGYATNGYVAFGDQTNDASTNGSFSLRWMSIAAFSGTNGPDPNAGTVPELTALVTWIGLLVIGSTMTCCYKRTPACTERFTGPRNPF